MNSNTPCYGQPILQLLAYKRIFGENGERFRLLLSDGQYLHSFCVLAMQLNHLMAEGELTDHAIIKVLQYQTPIVFKMGCDDRFVHNYFVLNWFAFVDEKYDFYSIKCVFLIKKI